MFGHAMRPWRTQRFDGAHLDHPQMALESNFSNFVMWFWHYSAFFDSQVQTKSLHNAVIVVSVTPHHYALWSSKHCSIDQCEKAIKRFRVTETNCNEEYRCCFMRRQLCGRFLKKSTDGLGRSWQFWIHRIAAVLMSYLKRKSGLGRDQDGQNDVQGRPDRKSVV